MTVSETRLLPLPSLTAAFVSMPRTAWYWLDDLVRRDHPGGYKALVKGFNEAHSPEALSAALRHKAQEHCDRQMAELYSLANDNPVPPLTALKSSPAHPRTPDISLNMPSLYMLFHFMPHATYLTTVWERRNYHKKRP